MQAVSKAFQAPIREQNIFRFVKSLKDVLRHDNKLMYCQMFGLEAKLFTTIK